MADLTPRRAAFRKLHESGCFILPNPWDRGSARYLEICGFQALATTSSGFAFSKALPDDPERIGVEAVLKHVSEIVQATNLPLNVDFQSGYSSSCEGVAQNVRKCVDAGAAGLSIEDSTGNTDRPLFELQEAVERIEAARSAIDGSGADVLLCGRAECFLTGHAQPLSESISRLQRYASAGADVLFAPGIRQLTDIRLLVEELKPKPVNVLISWNADFRVEDLSQLGVRRISVGSALSRAAWAGFIQAAKKLAEGSFDGFQWGTPGTELNALFSS
jgi:2-methylisocitrate lyase-like PEP mutase family enzyme